MLHNLKSYIWHATTWIIGLMGLVNGWFLIVLPHVLAVWPSVSPALNVKPMTIIQINAVLSLLAAAAKPVNQAWLKARLMAFLAWWKTLLASGSGAAKHVAAATGGALGAAILIAAPMVADFEGERNLPYLDAAKVLTVCYGHTGDVQGRVYSHAECQAILKNDLVRHGMIVLTCSPGLADRPRMLAAFLSFNFNTGGYCGSTARRLFDRGDYAGSCAQLSRWIFAKGIKLNGLVMRRADERALCEEGAQ